MTWCHQEVVPVTSLLAAWLAQSKPAGARLRAAPVMGVGAVSGALPPPRTPSGAIPPQPPGAGAASPVPPGTQAVLDALAVADPDAEQLAEALTVFGWERAATTGDLACTLAEVDELWGALEPADRVPVTRTEARHQLVDAWVDAVAAQRGSPGIDPLSGLHTAGYLYGRVHELDRQSDDLTALVLIAVRWAAAPGPWRRIAQIMQVASALRSRVRPSATLSQVGTSVAVALVPDDALSRMERIALTKAVEKGELSTANVQVDVFAVPDARSRLPELVTRLHGDANVHLAEGPRSFRHSGTGSLD